MTNKHLDDENSELKRRLEDSEHRNEILIMS